jgi:uncharacterized protein (TIGR02452 family)
MRRTRQRPNTHPYRQGIGRVSPATSPVTSGDSTSNTTSPSSPQSHPSSGQTSDDRSKRKQLAKATLATIQRGSYQTTTRTVIIKPTLELSCKRTLFYPTDAFDNWRHRHPRLQRPYESTAILITECTTLDAAYSLTCASCDSLAPGVAGPSIGVLNFASATKPGGGFRSGAQAQEESIARVSTLYPALTTPTASRFYSQHSLNNNNCFYSHSIVYSPHVLVFKTDEDALLDVPYEISVLTCAAVNAGAVREKNSDYDPRDVEDTVRRHMKERMGRVLACFEERADDWLVLGSWGTGVFKNSVAMIAQLWAELLRPGGRFHGSFERVVFAITGQVTFEEFQTAFVSIAPPSADP